MIPVLVMIILHSGTGTPIDVNAETITNMRSPEGGKHLSDKARCQVNMVDGKFVAVRETCSEVRKLMEGK